MSDDHARGLLWEWLRGSDEGPLERFSSATWLAHFERAGVLNATAVFVAGGVTRGHRSKVSQIIVHTEDPPPTPPALVRVCATGLEHRWSWWDACSTDAIEVTREWRGSDSRLYTCRPAQVLARVEYQVLSFKGITHFGTEWIVVPGEIARIGRNHGAR